MSNDIKGLGNSYTAEYWEYDPRVGRRWNLDPVRTPNLSPYASFENCPTFITDSKGDCPDGKCGDKEINAAYELVKKRFNPKKNNADIVTDLKADALAWYAKQYEEGKYPKDSKVGDYAVFEGLVMEIWYRSMATAGFKHYESNDRIIQSMTTQSGKALAIFALSENDKKNMMFFTEILIPNVVEFISIAGSAVASINPSMLTKPSRSSSFELTASKDLFSKVPTGASKLLGERGEDLTELMLRRAYPNATIAKQAYYYFSKKVYAKLDFVVINEGKIVAIWESKVNSATLSDAQKLLFIEGKAGTFGGKIARQFGLEGETIIGETIKGEIRYNSATGAATLIKH